MCYLRVYSKNCRIEVSIFRMTFTIIRSYTKNVTCFEIHLAAGCHTFFEKIYSLICNTQLCLRNFGVQKFCTKYIKIVIDKCVKNANFTFKVPKLQTKNFFYYQLDFQTHLFSKKLFGFVLQIF